MPLISLPTQQRMKNADKRRNRTEIEQQMRKPNAALLGLQRILYRPSAHGSPHGTAQKKLKQCPEPASGTRSAQGTPCCWQCMNAYMHTCIQNGLPTSYALGTASNATPYPQHRVASRPTTVKRGSKHSMGLRHVLATADASKCRATRGRR